MINDYAFDKLVYLIIIRGKAEWIVPHVVPSANRHHSFRLAQKQGQEKGENKHLTFPLYFVLKMCFTAVSVVTKLSNLHICFLLKLFV